MFKEELTSTLVPQNRKGRKLPNTFYEASITLLPKPDKDTSKKETYGSISLMNINAKILNKIMTNQIQQHIRKISTMTKLASSYRYRGGSTYAIYKCNTAH
jgi:hypothetical protein